MREMPNPADMAEAARLVRAGDLHEATALIQRSLSGGASGGDAQGAPSAARTAGASPQAGDPHETVPPEAAHGLLGQFGQLWRGLRDGVAPLIRGLRGRTRPEPDVPEPDLRAPPPEQAPRKPARDAQFVERSYSNADGLRHYKLFIPGVAGPRPLVVMLHGCTQSPDDFAAGTGMNALAEREGFYVAYPQQARGANAQKCWNWFEPRDQERGSGEAGIIAGITRAVMAEHDIDPARVYIAGLSAGGAAAANIARAYPDLYAAAGIHSGLAAGCARNLSSALMAMSTGAPGLGSFGGTRGFGAEASEAIPVPTIVFHGDEDGTVNPRNRERILAQAGVARLHPREETGEQGRSYTRTLYADDTGAIQVESWLVRGGGHAWSGGSPAGSFTDPQGPDASRAMLDFFRRHALTTALDA